MNETKRICWINIKKSVAFLYLIKENIKIESGFISIVIETIKFFLNFIQIFKTSMKKIITSLLLVIIKDQKEKKMEMNKAKLELKRTKI